MRDNLLRWLLVAVGVPAVAAGMMGCLQELDRNAATKPPPSGGSSSGGGGTTNLTCPTGEVCSSPGTTQCQLDSPECFFMCGSPLCAIGVDPDNPDAGLVIPPVTADPAIFTSTDTIRLANPTTNDPCVQIAAQSMAIRERSCAPCHGGALGKGIVANLNFILDDSMLASTKSTQSTPLVAPGNPLGSYFYKMVSTFAMPPPPDQVGMILQGKAADLVRTTPSDVSVFYAWILNCIPGFTDGGAYQSSAYGGGVNGTTCFGPCGAGAADAGAMPFGDAAVNAAVDATFGSMSSSSGASDAGTVDEQVPSENPCGSTVLVPQRAYASSVQGQGNSGGALLPASLAIDGNLGTRWGSLFASPESITLDYGAPVFLDQVQILWESACASAYDIEVSTDAINWRTAKSVTGNTSESMNPPADWSGADSQIGFALVARYLRINGTTRCLPSDGYSIWEMRAWGDTNATCSPE